MKKVSIILFVVLMSLPTFAQTALKRTKEYNLENKVALQGYDPVAYFIQKKALKGKTTLATAYEGVVYYFSTQANKEIFAKNPSQYEPQFGGWCAYAMGANAEKVEINPETFKIVDGKLYVFYNAYFNNTLKSWNKDEINLKKKAETNWKKFF
jgi:YHS domain-containing protein